jgi:hypothetical protein
MSKTNTVPVLEFRRLLYELKDLRPDICVRLRLLGEMWQISHCRVVQLTEKGAVLNDESVNRLLLVTDLSNVIQFELDHNFQNFQAHFHYNVDPILVY